MSGVMLVIQLYCQVCFPMSAADSVPALAKLAPKGFDFSEAETTLLRAVGIGKVAEIGTDVPEANDVTEADHSLADRTIRASVIKWLCMDRRAVQRLSRRGIQIRGARISGTLDLNYLDIPFLLDFENCSFPAGIGMQHTDVHMLKLVGSHVKFLAADGLRVAGSVFLRGGFVAKEGVVLRGATIRGDLSCGDGSFGKGSDGYALAAERATIDGSVHLVGSFRADGEVRLHIATILGDLNCVGGTFVNPDGNALNAEGADIQGRVFLCDAFNSHGTVRFVNSSVRGALECRSAVFNCHGGRALNAEGIDMLGPAILVNSLFKGEVSLFGARIRDRLVWGGIVSPNDVTLDLRSAQVGTLKDDRDSWPEKGKLRLNGLIYEVIDSEAPQDAETRLRWLGLRPEDARSHQPYEQLASVLRNQGDEEGATRVLIEKNKARAKRTELPLISLDFWWYKVLGPMVGYGYKPMNVLWVGFAGVYFVGSILWWLALGSVVFAWGHRRGVIRPADTHERRQPSRRRRQKRDLLDCRAFNPIVYSIDAFVPLINLHQEEYWLPTRARLWNPSIRFKPGLARCILAWIPCRFLPLYLWIHISMGWLLTTLFLLGLSGLAKT